MGYLKISRELLNSSFWRSLASAEKGILIDLMAMAAYKPGVFNLYGTEINLEKYELCFSVAKMAERFGKSDSSFRRFIDKLVKYSIIIKCKRKVEQTDRQTDRRTIRREMVNEQKFQYYTSITFCGWAFGKDEEEMRNDTNIASNGVPSGEPLAEQFGEHNQLSINQELLNESTRRNSACAVPVSNGSKGKEYRKPWYTMEQISKMDIPNAEEILSTWSEYAGKSKKDILDLLQRFTKNQQLFGLPEMTLDVFNREFRKEMKAVFALKSKHKNEPVQKLHYYFDN